MAAQRDTRVIEDLRARVRHIEAGAGSRHAVLGFGLAPIDRHLPGGGLALGALHEVFGGGSEIDHAAGCALFVAGILGRLRGPVLWCLRVRDLFAPALAAVGLHPDRVIFAETGTAAAILPTMEEGLRFPGIAGVVGESTRLGMTASRRLQLAAEASGVTAFVIRRWQNDAEEPSAAVTRWRLTSAPSAPLPVPGIGRERWRLELLRCRGAEPATWAVEACDAQGRIALAPDVADRPAAPAARRAAAG